MSPIEENRSIRILSFFPVLLFWFIVCKLIKSLQEPNAPGDFKLSGSNDFLLMSEPDYFFTYKSIPVF